MIDLEDVARLSRTGVPVDVAEAVVGACRGREGVPVNADLSTEVWTRLDLDLGSRWLTNNRSSRN